jgi:ankyrin
LWFAGKQPEENIHKAEFQLSEMCSLLQLDWIPLARELELSESDIKAIQDAYPNDVPQQALVSIHLWQKLAGPNATGY